MLAPMSSGHGDFITTVGVTHEVVRLQAIELGAGAVSLCSDMLPSVLHVGCEAAALCVQSYRYRSGSRATV